MKVGNINYTAWLIISCQLALHRQERWRELIARPNVDFYLHCYEYCRGVSKFFRLHGVVPDKIQLGGVDMILAKGATVHYAMRKHAIAEQVMACLANGVKQLVVVGGGFDALALRTAMDNPDVRCFEIDMPDMSIHKRACIAGFLPESPPNFYALGTDLTRESLSTTLRSHKAYDPALPTLFVAEGLSMYLPSGAIDRLLLDMRSSAAQASLIFTAVESRKGRGVAKFVRDLALAMHNEHFDWGMSQERMPEFLRRRGFVQQYQIGYADLQRYWRNDEEYKTLLKQPGEYLTYAQG